MSALIYQVQRYSGKALTSPRWKILAMSYGLRDCTSPQEWFRGWYIIAVLKISFSQQAFWSCSSHRWGMARSCTSSSTGRRGEWWNWIARPCQMETCPARPCQMETRSQTEILRDLYLSLMFSLKEAKRSRNFQVLEDQPSIIKGMRSCSRLIMPDSRTCFNARRLLINSGDESHLTCRDMVLLLLALSGGKKATTKSNQKKVRALLHHRE